MSHRSRRTAGTLAGLASLALVGTSVPGATMAGAVDPGSAPSAVPLQPNVVFVLADDLGHNDLSTDAFGPGSRVVDTPALDRMAAQGTVATDAYSSPTCSPTRMALLTGMSAPRPENNSYQVGSLRSTAKLTAAPQGRANGKVYLADATRTVAETAGAAGYRTTYVGKFHVAKQGDDASIVDHHGFETNFGGRSSGAAKKYHAQRVEVDGSATWKFDASVGRRLNTFAKPYTQGYVDRQIKPFTAPERRPAADRLVGTRKHVTDAIGDAMLRSVGVGQRPTFTFVGQYAVHSPVEPEQARADLRAKYGDNGYAALAEGLDQTVARLRRHLETTPDPRRPGEVLATNTVVIFTSDNGGRTQQGADNTPFRGQKFQTLEGGVRVPFLAWSGNPALVARGQVVERIVKNEDLYPTVAEYAGVQPPADVVDGASLVSTLAGGAQVPNREHVVHLPGYYLDKARYQAPKTTLRWNDWKLAYRYEDRSFVLHNLRSDPRETTDLLDTRGEVSRDLAARMRSWLARLQPRLPRLGPERATLRIDVPASTWVYRDGTARQTAARTEVVVRPGEEVPFIQRPDLGQAG